MSEYLRATFASYYQDVDKAPSTKESESHLSSGPILLNTQVMTAFSFPSCNFNQFLF